jgi:hypothetical protein
MALHFLSAKSSLTPIHFNKKMFLSILLFSKHFNCRLYFVAYTSPKHWGDLLFHILTEVTVISKTLPSAMNPILFISCTFNNQYIPLHITCVSFLDRMQIKPFRLRSKTSETRTFILSSCKSNARSKTNACLRPHRHS